jgi:ABC transport system ATP-binding/permease protein
VTEAVAKLAIFRRRRLQRLIELNDRLLKIGRGRQNDIVLDDPEQVVSRFHAELRPHGSGYVLVDLNSQNGTWVNAERIDRIQMRSGVPVEIGSYELVIEETRAS